MNKSRNRQMPERFRRLWTDDLFYFLSYGLFLVTSLLSTSFYYRYFMGYPYMALQIVCVVLLVAHEFKNGIRDQHWIGLAVMAGMAVIALWISNGNLLRLVPLMFLYTYCARKIPFAKIARFSLNISVAVVCIVVFSGYLGIIDNVVVAKGSRIREYLGFRYALFLPGILLNMTGLWIYLRKDKTPIVGTMIWAVVNFLVYYKTDSRISFALAEGLLLAAMVIRFLPKLVEKVQWLWAAMTASFGLFGVASVIMTAVYDSTIHWMRRLNSMLESRLSLGKHSLETRGVGFFGQHVTWIGNGLDAFGNSSDKVYTYVDCLYVKILQRYGILFTVSLLALLTWAMYRLWKKKEYHILLISAAVAVHCVLDDLSFALHYNTFWIAMGVALLCPAMLDSKTE